MEAPLYLFGLGLLILPPLLRMFFPPKPVHLAFPQMHLLNQVLAKQKFKKQNNPWWLNLIRMLLIALLTLSLVGLRWDGSRIPSDASLAIVYDDSFYGHQRDLEGEVLWQREKRQITTLLESIDPAHRVAMVGRSGSLLEWVSAREALDWLKPREPGFLKEDWATVMRNITRLHRQREERGFQIFFSGSHRSQDPKGFQNLLEHLPTGIHCSVEFFDYTAAPNRSLNLRASTQGASIFIQGEITGETQGQLLLHTSGGEMANVPHNGRFRTHLPEHDWVRVSLDGEDGFPLDDLVHVSSQQARPRRLFLLLRPEANQRLRDSGYYLEQGFHLVCQKLGLELVTMGPRQWKKLIARTGDLVLLLHPPTLREDEWSALGESLTEGAHLLILPGPTTPEDLLDKTKLTPARLKMGHGGDREILWSQDWKDLAPRVTELKPKGGWDFFHLNPKAKIELRYRNGGAYHLRLPLPGGGSFQLMSSPMAIHWSSSVLQPDFPAFLEHLLDSSLPPPSFPTTLAPGEPWPDEITSIQSLNESFPNTRQMGPGLYRVESSKGEQAVLARRFMPGQLLPRHPISSTTKGNQSTNSSSLSHGPRMDPWFVLAILFFLGLEALVLRRQLPHLLHLHSQNKE